MVKGTIIFIGTASDQDGTVVSVFVSLVGGFSDQLAEGTESWSFELDTSTLEEGEHHLHFRSFDGEDYSGSRQLTIIVEHEDIGGGEEGGGDDGVIPGFGLEAVILVCSINFLVHYRKNK